MTNQAKATPTAEEAERCRKAAGPCVCGAHRTALGDWPKAKATPSEEPADKLAEWLRELEHEKAHGAIISATDVQVLIGIVREYHEALLAVRQDVDVCDWRCDRCGKDQEMKETDLSDAVDRALARAAALIPKVKP